MDKDLDTIEIIDDLDIEDNPLGVSTQPNNMVQQNPGVVTNINTDLHEEDPALEVTQSLSSVNYDPIQPEQEKITIETESKSTTSKSGLSFVIVLFILLIAFVFALPYITKIFS